ncbi:hypothetical protein F4604DRAFT_1678546 [Suillus subluteus]|nr:hypothetical protein F4604DRAFT_1678546 [Suillus subluteus]
MYLPIPFPFSWKAHILEFIWSPITSTGVKVSAIKFMQCVIIVQTRGISDPRLQNKNDPNISNVPVDHPFLLGPTLEAEGMKLLESVITMLYTSQNPELLNVILHSWSNLVKQRPALVQLVVSSLSSWTPAALSGLPASSVKSIEKTVHILPIHISRSFINPNLCALQLDLTTEFDAKSSLLIMHWLPCSPAHLSPNVGMPSQQTRHFSVISGNAGPMDAVVHKERDEDEGIGNEEEDEDEGNGEGVGDVNFLGDDLVDLTSMPMNINAIEA